MPEIEQSPGSPEELGTRSKRTKAGTREEPGAGTREEPGAGTPEKRSTPEKRGAGTPEKRGAGKDSLLARMAKYLLSDVTNFSTLVLEQPLRGYQLAPLRPIIRSILNREGREFMLVFPRQSGKNEAVAQLLAYLLNLFCRTEGSIIYGATADTLGMGVDRLEKRLDNTWNATKWTRKGDPTRRCLENACAVFVSTHPQATVRGQTADWLLVVDEVQDQVGSHIESVFTPMRAANNATALYIGTVKMTTDYLWLKKRELEAEQQADGVQRIFMVTPDQVVAENAAYGRFLAAQVRKHGRHHPTIASEYFLEPVDGTGGLFDQRRRALMRGSHTRLGGPVAGRLYVATLDVAGEDEAATDPLARLSNPGRDYTVATIFEVEFRDYGDDEAVAPAPHAEGAAQPRRHVPLKNGVQAGPTYRARDVFVDHGSKHFGAERSPSPLPVGGREWGPGPQPLVERLHAFLQHWEVAHLVADQSGVGQGLVSWLQAAMGEHRVTGYDFAGRSKKAALGAAFLALIETGRFCYWSREDDDRPAAYDDRPAAYDDRPAAYDDRPAAYDGQPAGYDDRPGSDGWWFWEQAKACTYELPPDGQLEKALRWYVPASHRTDIAGGSEATHDDRLISAALVAELDRLYREGRLSLGTAASRAIAPRDPLGESIY
ncbi:hypothetical protein ACFLWA_09540 [Chloroflexota bacterium]